MLPTNDDTSFGKSVWCCLERVHLGASIEVGISSPCFFQKEGELSGEVRNDGKDSSCREGRKEELNMPLIFLGGSERQQLSAVYS